MLIYIFEDKNQKRYVFSEKEAHQQIRNVGNWQRQDFKYIGACQDTIGSTNAERREKAKQILLQEDVNIRNLDLKIELAEAKELKEELKTLKMERAVFLSDIEVSLNKIDSMTKKDDEVRTKFMKIIDRLQEEEVNNLTPDKSIVPKDFNRIGYSFTGNEADSSNEKI